MKDTTDVGLPREVPQEERKRLDEDIHAAHARLVKHNQEVAERCSLEGETSGWTAEDWQKQAKLTKELDMLEQSRATIRQAMERSTQFAQVSEAVEVSGGSKDKLATDSAEYAQLFRQWMQHKPLTADEISSLQVAPSGDDYLMDKDPENAFRFASTTVGEGGYTIPRPVAQEVITRTLAFGDMEMHCRVIEPERGATIRYPTVDDTSNSGARHTENTATATTDVAFGNIEIPTYTLEASPVPVSEELAQDSGIDIGMFIAELLGIRVGRRKADWLTNGTGTNQPHGILSNTTGAYDLSVTGTAPDFTVSTAASSGVATAAGKAGGIRQIREIQYNVDVSYRMNAKWMLGDGLSRLFRQVLSEENVPLWSYGGLAGGTPDMFDGYEVWHNNSVQGALADNLAVGAFGDFREGYLIVKPRGMQFVRSDRNLVDRFQMEYNVFCRIGGRPVQPRAYARITLNDVG